MTDKYQRAMDILDQEIDFYESMYQKHKQLSEVYTLDTISGRIEMITAENHFHRWCALSSFKKMIEEP